MKDRRKTNAVASADVGLPRSERLALALLDEVRRLEAGRRIHNEIEMERFKQMLKEKPQPVGGSSWKH